MLKLKKIAVTGILASGKSEVAKLLEESGAYRIDADKITHQLLSSQPILKEKIVHLLGPEVLQNGEINRVKMAEKVFGNPLLLEKLEAILHPLILKEILSQIDQVEKEGQAKGIVVEVPLLSEVGWQDYFDTIIGVDTDEALCMERYIKSGHTKEEYLLRMQRQWPQEKKLKKAHIILHNNGNIEELRKQLNQNLNNLF